MLSPLPPYTVTNKISYKLDWDWQFGIEVEAMVVRDWLGDRGCGDKAKAKYSVLAKKNRHVFTLDGKPLEVIQPN